MAVKGTGAALFQEFSIRDLLVVRLSEDGFGGNRARWVIIVPAKIALGREASLEELGKVVNYYRSDSI